MAICMTGLLEDLEKIYYAILTKVLYLYKSLQIILAVHWPIEFIVFLFNIKQHRIRKQVSINL